MSLKLLRKYLILSMDYRILRGYKPSGDLYRYIYTQILEPGHPGKVISISCIAPFISEYRYPGCLSRILNFIHPNSNKTRIQQQQQKRRGENLVFYFFCIHKYHKNFKYFLFEAVKKKI